MNTSTMPDFSAIKTRQQAAWGSGDYAVIGYELLARGPLQSELHRPDGSTTSPAGGGSSSSSTSWRSRNTTSRNASSAA